MLHFGADCVGAQSLGEKGGGGVGSVGDDGKELCWWEYGCEAHCAGVFYGKFNVYDVWLLSVGF